MGEVKPIAEEHFRWEMAATVQAAKVRLLLRVLDDWQGKAVVSVHLPVFRVGLTEKMVFLRGPTLHNARAIRHRLQPAMTTGFESGCRRRGWRIAALSVVGWWWRMCGAF